MVDENIDDSSLLVVLTGMPISEQIQAFIQSGQLSPSGQLIDDKPSAESYTKVEQALDKLSPEQRELLTMYQELTCQQIAERKQQSVDSIRQTISDLYARLSLQMESP